ncbi:MAG: PadR family transcriptional regulator [Butyricicoccus sp.]|nr:PadR family transcriptional regulator [Butyricicoccus sp.]
MAQNFTPSDRTRTLLILALLREGDKTGFEIIHALETRQDFSFALEEGMLYPLLYRLCEDGRVCSYEKDTEAGPRRFYKLTLAGIHLLNRHSAEWRLLCRSFGGSVGGEACARPSD